MTQTIIKVDDDNHQYSVEVAFKDKNDFIQYISHFQAKANSLGLAIQLVELPPTRQLVDKI